MNLLSAARHQTDETYADHPADRSPCHGKGHLLRGRAALYSPAEGVVLAFPAYAGSLLAMLAFVAGSVTVSWADLDVAARLTFAGLMGWVSTCSGGPTRPGPGYVGRIRAGARNAWMTWVSL